MRCLRIFSCAALAFGLACSDTVPTDVPDPDFNYMNNPRSGPVVFTTTGSPMAWNYDPVDGLGMLWGHPYEVYCANDVLPGKGEGHFTTTPSGGHLHAQESDVNIATLPIGTPDGAWPAKDQICSTQPVYRGHGFMRWKAEYTPAFALERLSFIVHGNVEDNAGAQFKLRYDFDLTCVVGVGCDLKQNDLVIW